MYRYVVQSPLQVLMALEARDQQGRGHDHQLVVLWPAAKTSWSSIGDVLDESDWTEVVDGGPAGLRGQVFRTRLVRRLARRPADHLFIGDYLSPYMRHLALAQPQGTVHLIDDGRGTVNTHLLRTNPKAPQPRADTRRWSRRVVLWLLQLRNDRVPALDYFTIFDLDVSPPDTITPNELKRLRSAVSTIEVVDEHLFLGSSFSERGMMAEDHYLALVRAVAEGSTLPLRYRPHRDENRTKLAVISGFGIEVCDPSATVELALVQSGRLPAQVSSFFSSASYTLWRLFGDRIDVGSYALEASDFIPGWFTTGNGLPTLQEQTKGALRVEPIPGRQLDPSVIEPGLQSSGQ
ncbi:MAG: hypothetical protein GY713_19795 [Actinomycetia bacterium]|nr:hypothetical protein [Actinomycetes bacterium]